MKSEGFCPTKMQWSGQVIHEMRILFKQVILWLASTAMSVCCVVVLGFYGPLNLYFGLLLWQKPVAEITLLFGPVLPGLDNLDTT